MKKLIYTLIFIFCFGFNVQARELTAQQNVSPNKVWTIALTDGIDQNTLNEIKVVDNYGNNIDIEKKVIGRQVIIEPTDGAWGRNVTYQLQTNNIKSTKGKLIKSPVTMTFTTGGVNYNFTGDYKTDAYNLCKKAGVSWHDGSKAYALNAYDITIFKANNIIQVDYSVDMWSLQNILNSSSSAAAMKTLVDYTYDYMKAQYPNEQIRVGIFLYEFLNKKIDGYTNDEISYDNLTGKYKVSVLLGGKYEDGKEYYITEGN